MKPTLVFLVGAAALFVLAGCSPSSSSKEDTAPLDIRGEPINPPSSGATQTVQVAVAPPSTNLAPTQPAAADLSAPREAPPSQETPSSASGSEPAPGVAANARPPEPAVPEPSLPASGQASPPLEFAPVGFDKLASFNFEIPDEVITTNTVAGASKAEEQIPKAIKALDQTKIALKGFMLPLKVESGLVTEMLIMRDQSMCCYGTVPKINEWVSVKMTNKGVKAIMDQPVTVFGKLHVGEMRENGYLVGIYALDGEKMAGPLDM